jgi:hypothetical protein
MSECLICGQKFKNENWRYYKAGRRHFISRKCLRVTNDLWDERESMYETIQNGSETWRISDENRNEPKIFTLREQLEEFSRLEQLYNKYRDYRFIHPDLGKEKNKEK